MSVKSFVATEAPRGTVKAGKSDVVYFSARQTQVTKKNVKGIPEIGLTIKATVDSPRTRRAIRRALGGAFGKEKLLKSEFNL